jgi:RimJ/RimL family protein N-acetyltransferase
VVNVPQLDSSRLKLRGFESEDFERYATMWTEPAVVRFIGGAALSREAAWSRFLRQIGHWDRLGFGFFAIEDRATGAFLGEAGFQDLHRALAPSIEGTLEAGWVLATAAHGKGLAEEAMQACLDWADRTLPDKRVTCIIRPDHAASLHIAMKLGFREFSTSDYTGKPIAVLERRSSHPFARHGLPASG